MPEPNAKQNNSSEVSNSPLIRLFLLSLLVACINAWMLHHLAEQYTKMIVTDGVLLLGGIVTSIAGQLSKKEQSKIKLSLSKLLSGLLSPWFLTIAYIALLAIGSFLTSITVISGNLSEETSISVLPEGKLPTKGDSDLVEPSNVIHELEFTTPFGRPFYLDAAGFQRFSFDLYPWVGRKIRLSSDLTIAPSLLIRIPAADLSVVEGATLELLLDSTVIAAGKPDAKHGSLLVGRQQSIPSVFIENWKLDLRAESATPVQTAGAISSWKRAVSTNSKVPINSGMSLRARFRIGSETFAHAKFTVSSESLQDIILESEDTNP